MFTNMKITGIETEKGQEIECKAVIIIYIRYFFNAVMHTGKSQVKGGRIGEKAASGLSEMYDGSWIWNRQTETGTPPRLHFRIHRFRIYGNTARWYSSPTVFMENGQTKIIFLIKNKLTVILHIQMNLLNEILRTDLKILQCLQAE